MSEKEAARWPFPAKREDRSKGDALVVGVLRSYPSLLNACLAVDRDIEQTGSVSEETINAVRAAIQKVRRP